MRNIAEEPSIIEIYTDGKELYMHIPASQQTFLLEATKEIDQKQLDKAKFVAQINLEQYSNTC